MDLLITIVYIVLFIILMIFVFSIGMLRPFMKKKEILFVLIVGFLIGVIGGAFFLSPVYSDLPELAGAVESVVPSNEETLYLDISSSVDTARLESELSNIEGFKSFEETGITFRLWKFNDREYEYFNSIVGNIDPHYTNYTVNQTTGEIYIALEDNYTASEALKSFSDWYKLVFGESISYAQVHAKVVVASSSLDQVEDLLLQNGIVASRIDGPVQNTINGTSEGMLNNWEFTLVSGAIGVIVALFGIYFDSVAVLFRRLNRFLRRSGK